MQKILLDDFLKQVLKEDVGRGDLYMRITNNSVIEKIVKRLFPENQQIKEKIEEAYDKLKDNGNKLGKVGSTLYVDQVEIVNE